MTLQLSRLFHWAFGLRQAGVALVFLGCSQGAQPEALRLDYATYNPVGLLLKDKGFLEESLREEGIKVEWVKSLGSNKALEFLNSSSVDFGSTAGAAALLARANGNPIRSVYVYSKPEWTALVTRADSGIQRIEDLRGKKVAATRGTDPFVFLLRALDSKGLSEKDIELVPLQHPDGKAALERGDVDAWAGLDPLMASLELEGAGKLFFRNADWNTYGVLNVREEFASKYPQHVKKVIAAYERARIYAIEHPDELRASLVKEAGLKEAVAKQVLRRTDLSSSAIGEVQKHTIVAAGDVLKRSAVIKTESDVTEVAAALIDPSFSVELAR